jgi:hypothetical protein
MHRKFALAIAPLAVLFLALLGCGQVDVTPGPDPDCPIAAPLEEPASPTGIYGGRLAPFRRVFDDGTSVVDPSRFWDSERGEACSFVRVEGGPGRCLPAFVWNSKPGWFADAACSAPVLITDACAELPRYARDETVMPWQACEPKALEALHPLAAPIAGDLYALDPLGNCVAKTTTPDAANVAMPLLAEIPLDAFVAGEEGP